MAIVTVPASLRLKLNEKDLIHFPFEKKQRQHSVPIFYWPELGTKI